MSYLIVIDYIAQLMAILLGVYFAFIWVFGGSRYRIHAFILVCYSLIYQIMPDLNLSSATYAKDYLVQINASMLIEGAAGLAMSLCYFFDRLAKRHAFILCFAILCHAMAYCSIKDDPLWLLPFAYGLHALYDELIICVIIAQMVVSKDGIIDAYTESSRLLQSFVLSCRVCSKNFREYLSDRKKKKGEIRT